MTERSMRSVKNVRGSMSKGESGGEKVRVVVRG